MELYVNGSVVESRSNTATGNYTVYVGDQIYVEVFTSGCDSVATKANAYTFNIIADASCGEGSTTLTSMVYTVQPGDVGNTLLLNTFASCDTACV
jgi:hypothetical protein